MVDSTVPSYSSGFIFYTDRCIFAYLVGPCILTPHLLDARRYFKQSEIILHRLAPEIPPTPEVARQQQIQMRQAAEQKHHQLPPGSATPGPGREHPNNQQQAQATAPVAAE